ncbi:MAG: Replicative helicase [Marmoricola sp.]|nr:Replicative helicase [Marmoricola sp.]
MSNVAQRISAAREMPGEFRRELPSNIEAEQALLGALLVNNAALDALPATFESAHFYEDVHRAIFDEIKRVYESGKSANPVTIRAALPTEMVGELTISQYLARLAANAVSIIGAPGFAGVITFEAMRRGLISVGNQAFDLGHMCGDELLFLEEADALKDMMGRIMAGLESDDGDTMANAAERALDATNDAHRGKGIVGVDYGFPPLMGLIGPAMPGQLIVIGGATKHGKSSLIEQLIMGAAMNGHYVWVYSGEMQSEELAHRALSRLTDIQAWRQIQGKVSDSEYEKLMTAKRKAETWQSRVILRDKPMTLAQISRAVSSFSKRHPGGMAVIDHIGLVERDSSNHRLSDTEFGPVVTRVLKVLANKCQVPVFAAAQLKKNIFAVEDKKLAKTVFEAVISRRPRYADILGAVEKDANHVVIPFRAEPVLQELEPTEGTALYTDWEDVMAEVRGKAEIILALSRHTRWPQRREVLWNGPRTMFEEKTQDSQGRML